MHLAAHATLRLIQSTHYNPQFVEMTRGLSLHDGVCEALLESRDLVLREALRTRRGCW
jgi:hypothetical protein